MAFQRARSEEQREVRRRAILDTASTMLEEMPVLEVGLNELSRRVGLAKSNVLRYFESREAVFLELLDKFLGHWLSELREALAIGVSLDASTDTRANQLSEVLSQSLAERVVLCDLFGAQGSVLEHNVSLEVVKRHKRAALVRLEEMTALMRYHLPELEQKEAQLFCLMSLVSAGALSSYSRPPPSLLAAYEDEPALGALRLAPQEALRLSFVSTLLGVLPRKRE
ncbi:TetR/AcrR family transcriptional regulator [Neorhizobium sp. DAR64872/K0K18]|uniref:TetR/AcrR family transcriptional regulator n=1 Tax=Neorhizobium sp. DAR64872/K0K18 TaxID=3421958 RepID=UPI003D27434C